MLFRVCRSENEVQKAARNIFDLPVRESFFYDRNLVLCDKKTLRGMRTGAKQKSVAEATASGARVPERRHKTGSLPIY